MHKYAKICIEPISISPMHSYAFTCTKYAKICKICKHEIFMQPVQNYALLTLHLEGWDMLNNIHFMLRTTFVT